ncbi:MAG: nuclear transport factor 2 family protein [Mycobacterium sp.]|uniref:nuclear transport factor 2 family protein n=1 Tax=Mycobacterium sp. TaxID=1785 RepID=UPI001EBDE631|nr:nuclear transport factor 2 family protein [Mycobacterium sp.]MBW0016698.1 nuclear transport factor 2 family protein [Mycobacterium sp.]
MTADQLQILCDERAIERALNLFGRAMDDRDWPSMADILAEDAQGDFGTGRLHGSAAIIDTIRGFLDSCGPTQHLLGNVVVEVTGDAAVSRAYVRDVHLSSDAGSPARFYTLGDYKDTWRRRADGTWCLTERIKFNRAYVGSLDVFSS